MTCIVPQDTVKIAVTSDLHRGFTEATHKIHDEFYQELNLEPWDVLILAGDLAITKFDQFKKILEHIRKRNPDRPILAVRGNHDFWDRELYKWMPHYHFKKIFELGAEEMTKNKVHHLDEDFIIRDVGFIGWDGWYSLDPNTNDELWLPRIIEGKPAHWWMREKALKDFERVLERAEKMRSRVRKIVAVTHFPVFPYPGNILEEYAGNINWIYALEGKIDVLCYGHTHKELDATVCGIRVINSGSDYDKPRFKIFDI